MSTSTPPEFYYHAHGTAISGTITRPVSHVIDTLASTALPIGGGAASVTVGPTVHSHPQLGNIVSFKSASTQLAGSFNEADSTHNTLVTVTIEGLNILDTVTADRIVLKLSSKHHLYEEEGHIVPLGTLFDNLKIAGHPIAVEIDHDLFLSCDTYTDFKHRYKADTDFRAKARKQFLWGDYEPDTPQFLKDRFAWHTEEDKPPSSHGVVPCTIVKSVKHDQPDVLKTYGNVIIVPQFGKVFLGELLLESGTRQVNMLRLQLGSPIAGDLTTGGGGGNGSNWP